MILKSKQTNKQTSKNNKNKSKKNPGHLKGKESHFTTFVKWSL